MTTPGVDRAPIASELTGHRYNDDLLLNEGSRRHAKAEFPLISHVLDNPELRADFEPIDQRAGAAKGRSQQAGLWAVVLAVLSLVGAAAEPLWRDLPWPWPVVVAVGAGLLGLTAVLLAGFGVLYGKHKDRWLLNRLCTERLRQLHFQAFIWKLPEIAASCTKADPHAVEHFIEDRRTAVAAFVHWLTGQADAELTAVLEPTGGARVWLYEAGHAPPPVPAGFNPEPLFRAYRKLRFQEQLGYADHKLRRVSFALAFSTAPLRNQRDTLRAVWMLAFGALIALHIVLVVGHFVGWHGAHHPLLHVGVVWLALVALGARTLEEGFGLSREIERYEDYRAEVFDTRERFDRATTPEGKLRAMVDMERMSFDEMRSFLRTGKESSFVL